MSDCKLEQSAILQQHALKNTTQKIHVFTLSKVVGFIVYQKQSLPSFFKASESNHSFPASKSELHTNTWDHFVYQQQKRTVGYIKSYIRAIRQLLMKTCSFAFLFCLPNSTEEHEVYHK